MPTNAPAAPHLLVGLNNNGSADHTITVATGFGANTPLHDYTGHSGDVRTDGAGRATITIPRNNGGLGYVCYSRNGIGGGFDPPGHDVTQVYEGAADLDIKPADNTGFVNVCRIYVDAGKAIKGASTSTPPAGPPRPRSRSKLDDPSGARVASKEFTKATPQGSALAATAGAKGFYTFRIRSSDTPAGNAKPSYRLSATYRAPLELKPGE